MAQDRSPLAAAVAKVGDRWALLLIEALLAGPRRFGELQAALPAIAPNVLSQRLKHLEREGIVVARAYSEHPPRFTYALTGGGEELAGALLLLTSWGAEHSAEAEPIAHRTCGTGLQACWYCPTCERTVHDTEADELRYA